MTSIVGLLFVIEFFFWVPDVSNFLRRLEMSSIIPVSLSLSFTQTSAAPKLLSFTSVFEAKALSANIARLSKDVLSGVAARCTRMDAGICQIKAWRKPITALPTTADPRRSISTPFKLIYLWLRKGCNRIGVLG